MNVGGRQFVDQFDFFRWRVRLGSCFIDTVTLTVRPEPVEELRGERKVKELMGCYTRRLQLLWRVASLNLAREPASCRESTSHCCPHRPTGLDDIMKDAVDRVLVKDAEIPIGVDVHFECLEFKAGFVRHVMQRDGAEIRQICFWANRGVFWNLDRNLVAFVLVRERFNVRQGRINAASSVPLVVA